MGLWDKIRGEFIDIVEWLDDARDVMVFRFPRMGNEIKMGAKLVVREGQSAVFINEGTLADVFGPGTYTLETKNLPILSTLQGWKFGFNSPFKAEVYFCNTRLFTDLKWGTPGPSTMRDPEFGAVRVTAFGIYAMRIQDPALFIREVVGTDAELTTDEIHNFLRGKLGVLIKEAMPAAGIPVLDLESKVRLLGETLRDKVAVDFLKLGLEISDVQVQDIGLPEEVEKAIDKGGAMRAIGNLDAFAKYESARNIETFAQNPAGGGTAGMGMGMGLGMAMGRQMGQSLESPAPAQPAASPGPPPIPAAVQYYVAIEGKQAGPFGMPELKSQVQSGTLKRDSLVWKQGMANWEPAENVAELSSLFTMMPPPIPGANR